VSRRPERRMLPVHYTPKDLIVKNASAGRPNDARDPPSLKLRMDTANCATLRRGYSISYQGNDQKRGREAE